jgi:hypothetical protein
MAALASVPDVIGDDAATAGKGSEEVAFDPEMVRGLMEQVAFEEQDIRDMLSELFEYMAERFESDHWKLTDRQARMIGKASFQLANTLWTKLMDYLPEILGKWCETTPGAAAFLMTFGIVVVPKVIKQAKLSRQRKTNPIPVKPVTSEPKPQHKTDEPRGIQAFSGLVS